MWHALYRLIIIPLSIHLFMHLHIRRYLCTCVYMYPYTLGPLKKGGRSKNQSCSWSGLIQDRCTKVKCKRKNMSGFGDKKLETVYGRNNEVSYLCFHFRVMSENSVAKGWLTGWLWGAWVYRKRESKSQAGRQAGMLGEGFHRCV